MRKMNRFSSVKINPININPMDITFGSLNILNDIVQQANDFIGNTNENASSAEALPPIDESAPVEPQPEEPIHTEEIPIEREVLIHLFETMGGNQWSRKTNWLSSKHIGQWYEAKVNSQGHIFRLGLSNNMLVSSLPDDIDKLSALQILDISKNKISGEIPASFGNLHELRCFYADGNELNSKIPEYLGNLQKLSQLNLANNQLVEAIPQSFGNLSELTELILSNNCLSGSIPSTIGNLYQLEKLLLNHNGLTGTIPSTFVSLCNLKELNLSHNQLSGTLPENWSHMIGLESLSLAHNQFTGIIPSSLFQLAHLKTLHLQHNKLLGKINIGSTQALFALEELDLSNNSLSGSIPHLSKFEHLKILNLSNNHLKCRNLDDCLQQLRKLKHVDLSHNRISGYLPRKLFHTANGMTYISLSHNEIHGVIPYSISKLIHAETIDFSHNQLHGELPEESYDGFQRLQVFNVSYNNISGNIPEIIFDLPNLKDFDISYNNYPIENMRCYLTGNRFTTAEKIIFSRELTCADTDLNSLEVVIRIARILVSSVFHASSSSTNHAQDKNAIASPNTKHGNAADHDPSSDLQVFMMLVLNHQELVMQAVCSTTPNNTSDGPSNAKKDQSSSKSSKNNTQSRIKWCSNPGYLIKLIKEPFYEIFNALIKVESESMLGPLILLKMYSVVVYAQRNDPSSEREFVEYEEGLAEALRSIFSLASLEDRALLYKLLLPGRSPHLTNILSDNKDGSGIFELLSPDSIIGICLDRNLKPVFSSPNVAMIITEIFSTSSRSRALPDTSSFPASLQDDFSYQTKVQQFISHLAKSFQNARYCPIIMFFLNCLTKVMTLSLSTVVLFRPTYSINSEAPIIEWFLTTMIICTVLYEFGQFHEAKYVFNEYAETVWNKMDLFTCISLSYWASGFLSGEITREASFTLALAVSAIPQSLSLLQYLCINKALGQLVIMIFAMSKNIVDFMLVFLFCIFGYGIYFCGLYGTLPGSIYATPYKTFLSLFGAALNNYDLSSFDDTYFAIVGSFIMVAYVTFTSILLLNLLIARMSSAHDIIADRSQQEWSFIQASLLTEYAVMEERNPLCVLPAPFNVITIITYICKNLVSYCSMMSSWSLKRSDSAYIISSPRMNQTVQKRVDIVSTVANIVIRIMFAFPIMLFSFLSLLINYKLAIELDGFEFEMQDDELILKPVFKCHDYLGFFGGNGSFHGYKNIDTIYGEAIDFRNAEKVLSHIKQFIFKHKANEKSGFLTKEELDEFMLSRPFVEALKDDDEIHESYMKSNPVRSFFRPLFCIPIVVWEYFHCFNSDTISYEKDESNDNVNLETSTKNILLDDEDEGGGSKDRNRQQDCIVKIYEEEEVIDLLRLLNMRSETVDRIETVKLHIKKLQGDVDSVKQQLEDLKTSIDASSKTQVELITDIFAKNIDELRYMIHK